MQTKSQAEIIIGEPIGSIIQLMTYFLTRELRCSVLREKNREIMYAECMV